VQREFVELLEQNQNIIHRVTNLFVEDPNDKKDLFQEILFQAWSSYPTFKSDSKFSTWLYRVALNTAINFFKKHKRKNNIPLNDDKLIQHHVQVEDADKEKVDILYHAINQLSPFDKALIMLYIDNRDYQEIAAILGISISYVGVKINRIKQFLRTEGNKYTLNS
jgi:RNA polymerase sigma-70 factor, ECF subfamily